MKQEQLKDLVKKWDTNLGLIKTEEITPDASSRLYYRLFLDSKPKTAVIMLFNGTKPAEIGGTAQVPVDIAYVELSELLLKSEVAVPQIYADLRSDSALIIEDVGSIHLADTLSNENEKVLAYYKQAIDQLTKIQGIDSSSNFFAFKRSFSAEIFSSEIKEFEDYVLKGRVDKSLIDRVFSLLVSEIISMPYAFSHRDYHSWNLLIDSSEKIRVIDFQDALLAPRAYDIASLLNDRDSNSMLGLENYQFLLEYYLEQNNLNPDFISEYNRVLLQRDLKVAGRFHKLARAGKEKYLQWVPGTLRRIGSSLKKIELEKGSDQLYSHLLLELRKIIPEIDQGAMT